MNRGLMVALVSAVVVLAVGVAGIAVYIFVLMPGGSAPAANTPAAPVGQPVVEAAYYEMDKFVTNLGDTDRLRYIDFTIALGLRDASSEAVVEENEAQVRDRVLQQVRDLKAAELAGSDGKKRLAEEVKAGLSELLGGHVTNVYVRDMVIQ